MSMKFKWLAGIRVLIHVLVNLGDAVLGKSTVALLKQKSLNAHH